MLGNVRDGGRDESGLSSVLVGWVDEVFNLSPQHVDSEHKPSPPPPPTRPHITTKSGDPNCVNGGDAKSPPHAPAVKLTPVGPGDEGSDKTTSDTNSDQDQVGLAGLSSGTVEGRTSHVPA